MPPEEEAGLSVATVESKVGSVSRISHQAFLVFVVFLVFLPEHSAKCCDMYVAIEKAGL